LASICLSVGTLAVTHQGAACDPASVHFGTTHLFLRARAEVRWEAAAFNL